MGLFFTSICIIIMNTLIEKKTIADTPATDTQEPEVVLHDAAPEPQEERATPEDETPEAHQTKVLDLGADPEDYIAPEEEPDQDEDVFGAVTGYGFADEEMQQYFRDASWKPAWQQPAAPTPLLPPGQQAKKDTYWKSLLTSDVHTIPNAIRDKILDKANDLTEEEQDYQLCAAINRSWAVDHLDVSRETVQSAWPQYRGRLARRLNVANTDEDVFLALSARESEKPLRQAGSEAYIIAYTAGLEGKREYDITAQLKTLSADHADNARGLATRAHEEGMAKRRRLMPLARLIKSGVESLASLEEDAVPTMRVLRHAPELTRAVRELGQMTREERNVALHVARSIMPMPAPGGDTGEGVMRVVQRAMRRGASSGGIHLAQGVAQLGASVLRRAGKDNAETLTAKWAEKVDKYSIVFDELRRLTQDELLPLQPPKSSGFAGQFMVDMGSALPEIVLSFIKSPVAGAITYARDLGQSTMDIRHRAPEAKPDVALTAGALGLLVQKQMEGLFSRVGGEKLAKSISRLVKQRGGGVKKFALHGAGVSRAMAFELMRELIGGKMGQMAGLLTQEAVMKSQQTASNIDWRQFGESVVDVNVNLREAALELPFILLGAGHVALRDFRAPRDVLKKDAAALIPWGISEAERKKIAAETDIDKQGELVRLALVNSPRWGGLEFSERAARALRLLNFNYFTEFNDPGFVQDFLKLPPLEAYTNKADTAKVEEFPPDSVLERGIFSVQHRDDTEYQTQLMELWGNEWRKAHYMDDASHFPAPEWELSRVEEPSLKRLAQYVNEVHRAKYTFIPRRLRREGLYAPFADVERKVLLRDRVADVNSISHLLALHSLSMDSRAEQRVSVSDMRKHVQETREKYLSNVAASVLRIMQGEDKKAVYHEMEKGLLTDIRDNLYSLPDAPKWLRKISKWDFEGLPSFDMDGWATWSPWINNPDMIEVHRICAGTRANIGMLAELLPLTTDYFAGVARGMTPLQASHHILLREFGFNPQHLPEQVQAALAENQSAAAFAEFCAENEKIFTLTHRMFGENLLQDTSPDGQPLWAIKRADGTQSPWHSSPQQAINDYVLNARAYVRLFDPWGFLPPESVMEGKNFRGEADDWFGSRNPFNGHDQLFSHASRDMLQLMDERAAFLQPGHLVNREHNHFCPIDSDLDDGVTPLFTKVEPDYGRYFVNQFTVTSPVAYLQSRSRVFWERMLGSRQVTPEQLETFLMKVEKEFPQMKAAMEHHFKDPNVEYRRRWSRTRNAALANKMSVYSTCYLISNLHLLDLPDSVRSWMMLTPLAPTMDDTKPVGGERGKQRRSVPRGKLDRGLMTWINRTASEKMRRLAPMLESMRGKSLFHEEDKYMKKLFDMSIGKDPVMQLEQGWIQLLCGEEVLRSMNQRWLNFMYSPMAGWHGLSKYEKQHLADFMAPLIRQGEDVAMAEKTFDDRLANMNNVERLELELEALDLTLAENPHMRQYGYVDPSQPFASMLLVDKKMPGLKQAEEPNYLGLPLYEGSHVVGCSVVPYGKFAMAEDTPPDVGRALHILSRLRMYPIVRPVFKGGQISWNGVVYGGSKGKPPHRLDQWEVVENPLESLLQMRDKVEQLEEAELEDTVANFDLLYNSILPNTHDEVYGNITVYRHPEKAMHICRLMPGEPFALHPRVTNPYVVQSIKGAYIIQRKMADTPALMEEAIQPLENFRPWGDQNRTSVRMEDGRTMAIRRNLNLLVNHPMDFNRDDTPFNASPREMLMRLAVDTGFLDTLNNVQPHQMDYGSSLTYSLINALYEYGCHPDLKETHLALKEITRRLRDNEEDYKLVFRVLRESARRNSRPEPIMSLFNWQSEESLRASAERIRHQAEMGEQTSTPESEPDAEPTPEPVLPVVELPKAAEINRLEETAGVRFAPVEFAPPNVLAGQQATAAYDEAAEPAPRAPLMKPVEVEDDSIWGDLFKLKHPEKKQKQESSAPAEEGLLLPLPPASGIIKDAKPVPRTRRKAAEHDQLFFDFGNDTP